MERKAASTNAFSSMTSTGGGGGGGHDRKIHIEWHPFLADYFVAGAEELQLYQVVRKHQHHHHRAGEEGIAKYR